MGNLLNIPVRIHKTRGKALIAGKVERIRERPAARGLPNSGRAAQAVPLLLLQIAELARRPT